MTEKTRTARVIELLAKEVDLGELLSEDESRELKGLMPDDEIRELREVLQGAKTLRETDPASARRTEFLMIMDPLIHYYRVSHDVPFAFIFKTLLRIVAIEAEARGSTEEQFMNVCKASWGDALHWKVGADEASRDEAFKALEDAVSSWDLKEIHNDRWPPSPSLREAIKDGLSRLGPCKFDVERRIKCPEDLRKLLEE